MVHRNKKENDMHEGKWNGLGGKFEPGETPEECAIREIREETGLELRNPVLRGFLTFPGFSNDEDWYVFVFTGTEFEGELIDSPEGDLAWIPDSEIADLPLWEGDRYFLKWIEEGRFFSAKFTYRNNKLLDHSVVFHDEITGRNLY